MTLAKGLNPTLYNFGNFTGRVAKKLEVGAFIIFREDGSKSRSQSYLFLDMFNTLLSLIPNIA